MSNPPSRPGEDVGLRGPWTFIEPLSERFTGSGGMACYGASGTVVLVKHGPRTTRREAGCKGRLWRLVPECRPSAEPQRRTRRAGGARPRRGMLSTDSLRKDQVAAHLGHRSCDERRHLRDKQRKDRLGEAAYRFLPAGTGAYRDEDDKDSG